jgi:hypothetical protein
MGRKLPPRENELYKRCDEVLHYLWDPIGVADAPGARDEYHSYLPEVFALVRNEAERSEIEAYLVAVETESMGLPPDRERARSAAATLLEWRAWIWEHTT